MTEEGFITAISGDTDVAGTLSIAAPRALYAVAFESKPKKTPKSFCRLRRQTAVRVYD